MPSFKAYFAPSEIPHCLCLFVYNRQTWGVRAPVWNSRCRHAMRKKRLKVRRSCAVTGLIFLPPNFCNSPYADM